MYAKYAAENSGSQDKLQTKHLLKYIEVHLNKLSNTVVWCSIKATTYYCLQEM
jgi:hypothetical protein